jgi:hypothetical protein
MSSTAPAATRPSTTTAPAKLAAKKAAPVKPSAPVKKVSEVQLRTIRRTIPGHAVGRSVLVLDPTRYGVGPDNWWNAKSFADRSAALKAAHAAKLKVTNE